MASPKPKPVTIDSTTQPIVVYGKPINVETQIQFDASSATITLQPGQKKLANNLFLYEFIEDQYKNDTSGGNIWLNGILHEIIIDKCRTDRDIIYNKPCKNFQAYLMNLAATLKRTKKIPYVKKDRIDSKTAINKRIQDRKDDLDTIGQSFGDITITIKIKLIDILTSEEDCSPEILAYKDITDEEITEETNSILKLALLFKRFRGKTCTSSIYLDTLLTIPDKLKPIYSSTGVQFKRFLELIELYKLS